MPLIRKLLALPSFWVALLLLVLHGVLIFGRKDVEIVYGDSGLMMLQARQLIDAEYRTFAFDYPGASVDPEREFLPYRKPFLAPVGDQYHIDFPPYFPLVSAPLFDAFGYAGLYIPGFLGLAATLFVLIACGITVGLGRVGRTAVLLLYGVASTVTLYNYIFHEYPLALALWAAGLFCVLRMEQTGFARWPAILFGFSAGLAVIFRMELALPVAALGLAYVIVVRERFVEFGLFSLAGFLLPAAVLLYANYAIQGHPLGLRYTLTVSENQNPDTRWQIIHGLLFSDVRGLIRQSPIFLVLLLAPLARLERTGRLLLAAAGIGFVAVLVTAPNHGDHIAPRYLFGLVAPGCLLIALIIRDFKFQELRRALVLFAAILALLSFRSNFKGYEWIHRSDAAARTVLDRVRQVEARHVAFDDYGPPLNLQNLFTSYQFFVLENPAEKAEFGRRLREQGIRRLAIAGPLTAPVPEDPRAFYETLKERGWPLENWRPERIFLDPPLFIVEVSSGR